MVNKIRFNGQEYNSAEEMPPAVRAAYDRALELAAQGKSGRLPGGHVNVKVTTRIRFVSDGKTYEDPEQMPPDVRAKYDKAMEQIDKDHNGIPDILEKNAELPAADASPTADPFAATDRSTLQPLAAPQPVITPDAPDKRIMMAIAGLALIVLLIAALALMVFRH